jgi:hypothetical protein
MEGGRKIISLTWLIDVKEANLNIGLSSVHLQVCEEEEKGRTTCTCSGVAWRGETMGEGARHACE